MGESILSWNVVTGSGQCMLAFQWYFVCLYFIFLCFSSSVLSFYICYIYILKCCHREWPVYAGHPVVGKLCWLFGFPFLHCPWRAKILFPTVTMMKCVFLYFCICIFCISVYINIGFYALFPLIDKWLWSLWYGQTYLRTRSLLPSNLTFRCWDFGFVWAEKNRRRKEM